MGSYLLLRGRKIIMSALSVSGGKRDLSIRFGVNPARRIELRAHVWRVRGIFMVGFRDSPPLEWRYPLAISPLSHDPVDHILLGANYPM